MRQLLKLPHDPHPWDDLWLDVAVKHPLRDEWWDERNLLPDCWIESTFRSTSAATGRTCRCTCRRRFSRGRHWRTTRMCAWACSASYGLTWPWESLHAEALAWFDHWLKGRDTGIIDGAADPLRRCRAPTSGAPPSHGRPRGTHRELALRADGTLADDEGDPGAPRVHGAGRGPEPRQAQPDRSAVDAHVDQRRRSNEALDMVGDIELRLVAVGDGHRTPHGSPPCRTSPPTVPSTDVTAGWLRASLREVDEAASRPGAPVLPCRTGRGRADRRGRRVPDPVGAQRSSLRGRPPRPAGADQRRPGSVGPGDHELPPRQRRHQQPEHRPLVVTAAVSGGFGVIIRPTRRERRTTEP